MEERGLVGLTARTAGGAEVGRISEVLADEESGEVTHVVVEREGERFEVPLSSISLDPGADFATFQADRADEEPGDHIGNAVKPGEYAPAESAAEDRRHEGQLVTGPESEEEAQAAEDLVREDWEDETHTPVDSGYPRTDAYVDPETGEVEVDPAMNEGAGLGDDVGRLLDGTGLEARSVEDGVVALTGSAARQEDLGAAIEELMGLDGVLEVDASEVEVGG